jgi:hypothetical protein
MTTAIDEITDLVTIEEAARRIGIGREHLRRIVKAAHIGVPWGGPARRPRFKVSLEVAARAVLEQRKADRAVAQPPRNHTLPADLPDVSADVTCWRP